MSPPITLLSPVMFAFEQDCAPAFPLTSTLVGEIEDDCAPAKGLLNNTGDQQWVGAETGVSPLLQLTPQLYTVPLPYGFTLVFGPFSPNGPAVLNPQAVQRLQVFKVPQPLAQAVDYTLAACGLLLPADQAPQMRWEPPTVLTAWLHLTNACNLDCPYCYVRKSNQAMAEATGLAAIEATFQTARKHGFETVKLKYAGGEVALHFKVLQRLHAQAQVLAAQTGLALQGVVLSNGTLWTPMMARWLDAANVKLVISLDGVGAAHDAQRPTRGGRGSFAKVEYTVDEILLPAGVRPDITITVTGRNAHAVAGAVTWAIERDLPFSLNFYRENLRSDNREDLKLEETRIIEGLRQAYAVVEKYLPARPFLNGLLDRAQGEAHNQTCGVGTNYLVFSHTGTLAQCQMHLDEGKKLARSDDALEAVARGVIPVISVDEKASCQNCLWRYRCAGGCPLETYRATGRFDVQSPHCNIYTTLFPEALRLEGLRLLKLNGYLT